MTLFGGIYILKLLHRVYEHFFHQNSVGSETFRIRYRTTYRYILKFSKTNPLKSRPNI